MAKHVTHKSTLQGKHQTKMRNAARAAKRGPAFDAKRLEKELAR